MTEPQTIFAVSSGKGAAGVAVIRVSGRACLEVAAAFGVAAPAPRMAKHARLHDPRTSEILDTALILYFAAPASFTGEDVLELHVHGGAAVIAAVLSALASMPNCRQAEAGEFTRRAFHNGKMDLTEAEGLADLIAAQTQAQRRQAIRIAGGQLRGLYQGWRAELINAMALMEAALDFSDEADVAADAIARARQIVATLDQRLAAHLDDGHRGEILRDGLKIVIAGPPNAGKSSLLNALARRDVAIVSPEPGTTRDVLEVRLDLGGYPVIVSDTAGLRTRPLGQIEHEGIRRTLARSAEADLVLWLVDANEPDSAPADAWIAGGQDLVTVTNKADLAQVKDMPALMSISALTGQGLPDLLAMLAAKAAKHLDSGESAVIANARQRGLLEAAKAALADFAASDRRYPELAAEDLRRAAQALGRLTGAVDAEDVLDRVFGAFCIGK